MKYFANDSVKLIVNYQWIFVREKILKFLFIPFVSNMVAYNFYCIVSYENTRAYPDSLILQKFNSFLKLIILLFTGHTVYVENK